MPIVFPHHQDQMADLAAQARPLADALDRLAASDLVAAPVLTDWFIRMKEEPALAGRVSGDPSARVGSQVETDFLYAVDYHGRFMLTFSGWYVLDVKSPSLRRRSL